ncbi:glycosyltransferase family 1 protein [Sporolactobacillus sp. CPB3-1]|uniref:Glycosyltransferase family 1 protein n=1 Tax=Sporolactobacillus mangiferae TaxID=2940498 RepID=A0ABT0MD50_9BACL|nr:glycosyltransferase family 1 protein [Sporolactobacillus mangiferae]MCL1632793.1 glycosyltransferase family 1 protein [Sporolactobacillus mangiferae]
MKLAIFTDTYTPQINGVAKTLKRLTDYLNRKGIDYMVFAPQNVNDEWESVSIQKIKSIPFAVYPECRLALPTLHFIKKQLIRFQPDLIHVATPFNMGLIGRYYAGKLNIPLVGSYHTDFDAYLSYYKMDFLSPILWHYLRWFHNSLQRTFVPSQVTKRQLETRGFNNLSIWSRGVDCQLFHPQDSAQAIRRKYGIHSKYMLSFAGRLAPEKDIDTLVRIMKKVNEKWGNDVHWLIAGDGPLAEQTKAICGENVTFTGYLTPSELAQVFASSDLMVFPSPTETFGNVVLESMACGTPVIGADSGGVKTIISNHKNGVLCEPKNSDAFSEAIASLLNNTMLRHSMGLAARHYALEQSWDRIFGALLNEYIRTLDGEIHRLAAHG